MNELARLTAALALTLSLSSVAFAQQSGAPQPMNGMQMQGTMPGMNMQGQDMQAMMNQCSQMRQQMQPGARMTPDMTRMMQQCDQMDQQMSGMSGGGSTSTGSAAPRTRTR